MVDTAYYINLFAFQIVGGIKLVVLTAKFHIFSPIKMSITDFSAPLRARIFKFCIHLDSGQLYCGEENQDDEI